MKWYKVLIYLSFYKSSTKKITIYRNFNLISILGKSKIATIVGDVTAGLQQRHHPQNIPPLVEKIKGFPLKAKSFRRNTASYQKLWGRVPSTIVGDVTAGLQQRHHPQNIPPLVEKIKGFPLKAKSFRRNTASYQKLWGRVPSTPPPSPPPATPLHHSGGMDLRVRLRVTLAVNVILNSIFPIAFPSTRSIPVSSPTDTTSRPKHSTGTFLPQLNILVL